MEKFQWRMCVMPKQTQIFSGIGKRKIVMYLRVRGEISNDVFWRPLLNRVPQTGQRYKSSQGYQKFIQ